MMCCYIYCSCLSALSMNNPFLYTQESGPKLEEVSIFKSHLFLPIYTGPKVEEVAIFWQMVMEHKPAVVVMLTNVEENGKVWMVFESLQLTNTKAAIFDDYCMPRSRLYLNLYISLLTCAICSRLILSYLCIFCTCYNFLHVMSV